MDEIVQPEYASINLVRDICDEWIDLWGGDEWGESMRALHSACHTSYGFTDEDCALFANKLLENLIAQADWVNTDGIDYFPVTDEAVEAKCRELRDYWSEGGNLKGYEPTVKSAKETIAKLPSWLFGE